jgi:S-adenosylmethionine decarboxylase proenzyme
MTTTLVGRYPGMVSEIWNENTDEFLESIANKAKLAESGEGVRDILLHVFRNANLKNKDLSRLTQIAIPAIAACRGELVKEAILKDKRNFSPAGRDWARKTLGFQLESELANGFSFTDFDIPSGFESFHDRLAKILTERPGPRFDLDQSRADSITVTKRVVFMLQNGDIEGRNIIFLGDDDGTSLGASMLGAGVTVLEIDPRITDYLVKTAELMDLENFVVIEHDLTEPVPERVRQKFDVFFTDPPYTIPGLKLFVLRGKSCLKSLIGKRGYVCYGAKPPVTTWKAQLVLLNAGFSLRAVISGFNRYRGASIIGQHSSMYYLKQVNWTEISREKFTSPYYTAEVKESKFPSTISPESKKEQESKYLGFHIIAEFYGVPTMREMKTEQLERLMITSCQKADLSIVEVNTHHFYPHGVSVVIILEESHANLHTWPENDYCSVDIFACSGEEKARYLEKLLEEQFKPEKVEKYEFYRGARNYGN